jgi:hypothetical protein
MSGAYELFAGADAGIRALKFAGTAKNADASVAKAKPDRMLKPHNRTSQGYCVTC